MTRIAIALTEDLEGSVKNALKFADLSEGDNNSLMSALSSRYIDVSGLKILKQSTDRKGVPLMKVIGGAKLVFPTHRPKDVQQARISIISFCTWLLLYI